MRLVGLEGIRGRWRCLRGYGVLGGRGCFVRILVFILKWEYIGFELRNDVVYVLFKNIFLVLVLRIDLG